LNLGSFLCRGKNRIKGVRAGVRDRCRYRVQGIRKDRVQGIRIDLNEPMKNYSNRKNSLSLNYRLSFFCSLNQFNKLEIMLRLYI